MKLTKSYLKKVIKEELENLSEFGEQEEEQPKQKGDVQRISKVMEKLPQLQRLFSMINTQDELTQVLDNLIKGVSGSPTITGSLLKKVLLSKAKEAGGLSGE